MSKVAVRGLLARHGPDSVSRVRARVVPNAGAFHFISKGVLKNVQAGANLNTDAWHSYDGLEDEYVREVVNHFEETRARQGPHQRYGDFWSLLKRGIRGTYVSVEPFRLWRHLDEKVRRFSDRHMDDLGRFLEVVRGVVGRRLTYESLTGPCRRIPA